MQIINIQLLSNVPFDDYLAMPGWSHSGIKSIGKEIKAPTRRMNMGTAVHHYLLEPEKYDHSNENHELIKALAIALKNKIGSLYRLLIPERVVTADFCYNNFVMPFKGRLDLSIENQLVIDIKVSKMPLEKAIKYFEYEDQLSGYALPIRAKVALIIGINPDTVGPGREPIISIANIPIKDDWWKYQVIQKGNPVL